MMVQVAADFRRGRGDALACGQDGGAGLSTRVAACPCLRAGEAVLRNGQAQNPQKRLIEALARTFGVPPAFFFDDYDEQASLLQDQVELLALVRDARISSAQLRAILELSPQARQWLELERREVGMEQPLSIIEPSRVLMYEAVPDQDHREASRHDLLADVQKKVVGGVGEQHLSIVDDPARILLLLEPGNSFSQLRANGCRLRCDPGCDAFCAGEMRGDE
jgi:transcriptional regulator with XRE-family HTH domain